MNYSTRFVIYYFLSIFVSLELYAGLWLLSVPTSPINWAVCAPLLMLPIPALILSRHDRYRFSAVLACAIISLLGYLWHFSPKSLFGHISEFNQLYYTGTWAAASLICFALKQRQMGYISIIMVVFGAAMMLALGSATVESGAHNLWRIALNIPYVAVWVPPVVMSWAESHGSTQAKISSESKHRNYKAAA